MTKRKSHKATTPKPKMECRMAFRVTRKEKDEIEHKVQYCGLSQSEYIRKCVTGHRPKLHLTEQETKAFISLADARADLIHIKNALGGKSQDELLRYFRDANFMNYWIVASDKLIRRWYEIETYLMR